MNNIHRQPAWKVRWRELRSWTHKSADCLRNNLVHPDPVCKRVEPVAGAVGFGADPVQPIARRICTVPVYYRGHCRVDKLGVPLILC